MSIRVPGESTGPPGWIHRWLTRAESLIYLVTALLLIVGSLSLLGWASWGLVLDLGRGAIGDAVLIMLDRLLLVLMLAEILYTVRASLQTHALLPEPFLIVGLIAAVRRVLVITAEAWHLGEVSRAQFEMAMMEMGVLVALILAIVVAVILLRRHSRGESQFQTEGR